KSWYTRYLAIIPPDIVNASLMRGVTRRHVGRFFSGADSEGRRGPLRERRLALQPRAGGAARRQLPARAALVPVLDRAVRGRQVIAPAHAVPRAQADARTDQPVRP